MASIPSPAATVAKRKGKRASRALPLIITLAVAGAAGWWGWAKTHPVEDPTAKMLTDKVKRGDLVETVTATGSVTAQTGAQVKIGSQITGTIKRLYADVGSQVKAGQMIAELDLPDMRAQMEQAQASVRQAQVRLLEQQTGLDMQKNQSSSAVEDAKAAVRSAQARLESAEASSSQQNVQTPTDIRRAQTNLASSQAAFESAQSNLAQVKASYDLQIANANESLAQATATAKNSDLNLKRQQGLLDKGFVAASIVDAAAATNAVAQSQVKSAQQNISLVQAKVKADLQAAQNEVTQARATVESSRAALEAAQAGTYSAKAKVADVNTARAQVRQAEANLKLALGNTTQNLIKKQQIDENAQALAIAERQVDYYRAQLNKTLIRSPISGTVLQLASQQGETLAAGLSAPTLIIVADLNRLQVDAFVDETDIGKIKIGQPVEVRVDAFAKRGFPGKVTKVASGSTIQQGVITYDVTIGITDPRHQLKPDMTASVVIETGKREGVLLVPSEAVKVSTRGSTVNTVKMDQGKKTTVPQKVKTGGSDGQFVEIREGLNEGDTIVLAGMEDASKRGQGGGPQSPFGPSRPAGGGGGGGGRGR
jgi:HlyD family secretion protein